jgi:hypothetical protein
MATVMQPQIPATEHSENTSHVDDFAGSSGQSKRVTSKKLLATMSLYNNIRKSRNFRGDSGMLSSSTEAAPLDEFSHKETRSESFLPQSRGNAGKSRERETPPPAPTWEIPTESTKMKSFETVPNEGDKLNHRESTKTIRGSFSKPLAPTVFSTEDQDLRHLANPSTSDSQWSNSAKQDTSLGGFLVSKMSKLEPKYKKGSASVGSNWRWNRRGEALSSSSRNITISRSSFKASPSEPETRMDASRPSPPPAPKSTVRRSTSGLLRDFEAIMAADSDCEGGSKSLHIEPIRKGGKRTPDRQSFLSGNGKKVEDLVHRVLTHHEDTIAPPTQARDESTK